VGAPYDSRTVENGGAVYVFDAATGAMLETLVPTAADGRKSFLGGQVETDGGKIVAVASEKQSAVLYGWPSVEEHATLDVANLTDNVGASSGAALLDEKLYVSARGANSSPGVLAMFNSETGELLSFFTHSADAHINDFAHSVAAAHDTLIVAANNQIIVFNIPEPIVSWHWGMVVFSVTCIRHFQPRPRKEFSDDSQERRTQSCFGSVGKS
jgi:hypothetical protein